MQKIESLYEEFELDCKLKGLSDVSIKTYRKVWEQFVRDAGIKCVEQLTSSALKKYKLELLSRVSVNTVNNYMRHIRVVLNYFYNELDIIDKIPIKMSKVKNDVKDVFSDEELAKLLKKPNKKDTYTTWRSWLAANILANTGMRGATLLALMWDDVDLQAKIITLNKVKGSNGYVIPMNNELAKVLYTYNRLFPTSGNVIQSVTGKSIGTRTMQQTMFSYHRARGVNVNSLHQYRRTFITNAIARGVDSVKIARVVGHKGLQMIQNHYYNATAEHLRSVVE